MIQKKIVDQKIKEFEVQEYIINNLKGVGHSHTRLQMTPLGEKIIISASRPGLIVGRKGQSIKKMTAALKKRFNMENPQIEINEVENVNLDPNIISERIANSLERYGATRFKGVGHKAMEDVMNAGAMGVEILISGKIPGARAKRWRFYQGYLKKCGDIVLTGVKKSYTTAQLKIGTVGIQVRIMPPGTELPDRITIKGDETEVKEVKEEPSETKKEEKKKGKKQRKPQKKTRDKKSQKKTESTAKKPAEKTEKLNEKKQEKQEKPTEQSKPKEIVIDDSKEEAKEEQKEKPAETKE